ncbi:MAG: PIN domain-containing protein [Microcystis panniformis Mp_MB_F_20051200_S9]|jgi:predicted nucleic acid-binding protein|uniref:PIN domain-containing protein n=1 Tax=Microcystis panniformis Mp_MB_F_20051200_S9 TaxID=2486223 RepID=A0A552PKZ2_9CHRO|nr:MAG: PIN domain-containing protein [Microcystis panniformis Mp_GB_SS_20050300_S99]TRV53227.1 MAG: PIN domain-containing protein [Microcystis panniformis Mp_MB_F_20080800_S26D]TRV54603.1 MAG: PIN domain-containing protein [Microcystis panniformis Mp_GB_SS_20050300_S99D]TRV57572.1 MAG: PIN domain-containing protein [Microcystis panniformis Mp_MB_F_20051200_S9]TRV61288.1 MAG: PIN domain-containing protein [Microcystis panniformis Mp_MB_F_20080800_S26]TRV67859.1 MAG: PIN domain-containing prote
MSNFLRCVIDANVGIKRFIADPLTPKVRQLFDTLYNTQTEIYIPDLFYIEITNIFWKYVRAGLYSATQVQSDLTTLKDFPLRVISTAELMGDAFQIAYNYQISAYDGAYVALSERVKAPLLTLDRKLVNSLASSTYQVYFFADFSLSPFS